MIYIRKLELVDNDGNSLFRIQNKKAIEGLAQALDFVDKKDGRQETTKSLKAYFKDLDKEFKKYFWLK